MNFRNILLLIVLSTSNILFAQTTDKKGKIVIKTKVNCNHCKICETCGQKFETDLYYVKGIKIVEYNELDTTIIIHYNTKKTNPDLIRAEISKLGYSADNVTADSIAVNKLDKCCRRE